ncbi:MAG: protoporphyrinogen oxidase [Actinomycetota bacterium]
MTSRAVVVGGGISGLVAAFDLARAGWSVTVDEAADRWGGRIFSSPVGDRSVDGGPDAFLARVEHGHRLCADLGIDHLLTSPSAPVPAYVFTDGVLHELPDGTMFGVPTDLDVLKGSGLISPGGIERAGDDLSLPVEPGATADTSTDTSVGAVCRARLGDEVTDRLIDPLIGAINASDIDRLSLRAAAPQLAAALDQHGSLIRGMADLRERTSAIGSRDPDRPVFYGLPGGTATIVDRLVEELTGLGVELRLRSSLTGPDELAAAADGAEAIILAVPAFVAARLVGPSGDAATILDETEYADVTQVVAELPVSGIERVLDASGILFPRVDGRLMTACTWLSTKWAHYHRDESVLVRLSTGRFGDERHHDLDDGELVAALLGELSEAVPVTAEPIAVRIGRWDNAFPQYTPGHHDRVARARAAARELDRRFHLVGASYDGIGVPACIATARSTVAAITGE